jgi:hypothetical protein
MSCYALLSATMSYYELLSATINYYPLLAATIRSYPLLSAATHIAGAHSGTHEGGGMLRARPSIRAAGAVVIRLCSFVTELGFRSRV